MILTIIYIYIFYSCIFLVDTYNYIYILMDVFGLPFCFQGLGLWSWSSHQLGGHTIRTDFFFTWSSSEKMQMIERKKECSPRRMVVIHHIFTRYSPYSRYMHKSYSHTIFHTWLVVCNIFDFSSWE